MPEEEVQRPKGGNQKVKQAIALIAFAALAYWDTILWAEAQQAMYQRFGEGGWGAWLSQGWNLAFVAAIGLEVVMAGAMFWGLLLARADDPTEAELGSANLFIFLMVIIVTILGEIFLAGGSIPFGWPGWVFALLVLLFSILSIYLAFIGLFIRSWILARRKICTVLIPQFRSFIITLWKSVYSCIDWAVETYKQCAQWGTKTTQECANWGQRSYNSCSGWGTSTTKTCQSWLPSFLGWICMGWNVLVQTVCIAWVVVVEVFCVAWFLVVQVICLLFVIVSVLVCLVWALVVLAITIVITVITGILVIVFFC